MAEQDYMPDQDNESQGWASKREDGAQPARGTRKVYRSYQKEAYQQDLAQEVRKQMKEGQEINPRQKILAKKQADLPEDPFKMMKVGISGQLRRAGQQVLADQDDTGNNLFLDNLEKGKAEREAKMKQYKRDLANQIQERASNPIPRNQSGAQKINNTSPPGARAGSAKKVQRPRAPAPRFMNPEESVSANAYFPNMQEQGDEGYAGNYDGYNGSRNNLGGEQPWNSQRSDGYSKQKGTGRLVSGVSTPGNEFFERNFGRPLELKKKVAEDRKKELVDELQKQIDDAKDKKRREKLQQQMEDMKAEERYLKEIERMREFSANRKKVAEAVNDQEVEPRPSSFKPQSNAYLELAETKRVTQRAPFVDPMLQNDFSRSQAELEPEATRPISKTEQAKASRRVSRDLVLLAKNDLQGVPKPEVSFGGTQMSGRSYTPASFGDGGAKSQEYQSRVNLAAQDRLEEKKRELRMNTNLLYRQVIDLRGEKDYSGAMRDNAVMAYQEVQRKLNEANKALANDIQKVLYGNDIFPEDRSRNAPKEWYLQGKLSDWTKKDSGIEAIENPDPKLDEYRRAGLLMAQDSVYFSDQQQIKRQVVKRSKIGEDGRIEADTDIVPIIEKEPDRNTLEYLGNMSEPEFADMVAKEAKGERLTSKYSKETHQERMAELRKKNLDFDSLLDQMVRECRNIYDDDIGVYPSKAGRGVDSLDRIIDNLYNDNFKLKYGSPTRQRTDLVNGMTPEELEDDTPRGKRENLETVIEKLNGGCKLAD